MSWPSCSTWSRSCQIPAAHRAPSPGHSRQPGATHGLSSEQAANACGQRERPQLLHATRLLGNPFKESLPQETHSLTLSESRGRGKATNISRKKLQQYRREKETSTAATLGPLIQSPSLLSASLINCIYKPTHTRPCASLRKESKRLSQPIPATQKT